MSEKEYLVDIFQGIYRKHAGKFNDPDPNENGFFEMKKAANEYASSLLPLGNQWKAAVVYDIESLNRNGTIPPSIRYNKEKLESYKGEIHLFLCDIKNSLRHHGFDIMELPKDTLAYMGEEAFIIDKQTKKYVSIHPKELEAIRQQRKTARKKTKAQATATDANKQAAPADIKPATDGGNTQTKTEETSIFTDCIANAYRNKQASIETELKKVLKGKKGKKAIIVFVACYFHGILRKCPSHQQALYLSESIGTSHRGYDTQKQIYFSQSEDSKRDSGNYAIYDILNETEIDTIRELIIAAEAELKPLFKSLEIDTGDTATDASS